MEKPLSPTIVLRGNEDHAQQLVPRALNMYQQGVAREYFEDDSLITIADGVITIETTHHAPIQLFSPLDYDEPGAGTYAYKLWLLGCAHRKDAMLTAAEYSIVSSTYEAQFPVDVGPELIYMSDGVAYVGHAAMWEEATQLRSYKSFIGMFGVTGITEDSISEGTNTIVGPSGVANAITEVSCLGCEQQQSDNLYSACCYGTDRTDPLRPKYRFIVGCSIHTDATMVTDTWYYKKEAEGPVFSGQIRYYVGEQVFIYVTAQQGEAPTAYYYSLGYDVFVKDKDGDTSLPPGFEDYTMPGNGVFPVIIPLGNQRVFIVYRKRIDDTTQILGGRFQLFGKVVSGMGMTQTDANIEALKEKWSATALSVGWSFGAKGTPEDGGGGGWPTIDNDEANMWWCIESLAVRARYAVPISQDETLVISTLATWEEDYPPGSNIPAPWSQVCWSFTPTGVTKKSTLVVYGGHDQSNPQRPIDYFFEPHGAVHGSAQNVYVLFERYAWTGTWVNQGPMLFTSTDDGATWDSGQFVTMTNDEDSTGTYYLSSQLLYLGRNATDTGDVLSIGYADTAQVTGAREIKNPKLMTSEDSGVTWTAQKSGGAGRQYTWPNGYYLYHTSRGLCSAHLTGDAVDGFEPSPYRHLPTYYGTPTKACRTFTEPNQ